MNCQEDLHGFLKEAEIMKNFDHENVVKLLGKIEDHKTCVNMYKKCLGPS